MKITIARHAGFCFGVRRAIDITFKVRQKNPGKRLFTVGPIIHNPQVIEALTRRGIGIINDILDPRLGAGDIAIIRAHGISPEKKALLKERGVKVIDATCPMVLKVHAIIKKAAKVSDAIAIIGDKDHPEMEAHLGVAAGRGRLIQTLADAQAFAPVKRLAVVAQTTFDVGLFKEILSVLREKAEVIDVYDTICRSTVDRQKEVEDLAKDHDTFIVIGGRNSGNTKRLSEIAANQKRHVYKVESGEQLSNLDTSDMHRVAIIAGASTPQWVIEECIDKLRSIDAHAGLQNTLLDIVARSPLCPALGSMGVAMAAFVFCSQGYNWNVLLATFFLAFASVNPMVTVRQFVNWSIATGLSLALGLIGSGLYGGLLIIGVALLRPLMNTIRMSDVIKSIASLVIFLLVSIIVPLGLTHARIAPGVILLAAFVALQYLGSEILIGLKNSERDAIIGRMSLARYLSESRGVLLMEYAIMGLALILFLS
ncbi:MAG TPA: 4-hydroxy-3-methylbut-2-enyl diphosphate reductase, partial [Deltaproteobacteria bacterium]|nr:4-hydroxy-3-methylbut-2-enyl diphosphate reductase [Deltaproteobacteria bacterium]